MELTDEQLIKSRLGALYADRLDDVYAISERMSGNVWTRKQWRKIVRSFLKSAELTREGVDKWRANLGTSRHAANKRIGCVNRYLKEIGRDDLIMRPIPLEEPEIPDRFLSPESRAEGLGFPPFDDFLTFLFESGRAEETITGNMSAIRRVFEKARTIDRDGIEPLLRNRHDLQSAWNAYCVFARRPDLIFWQTGFRWNCSTE